MIGSSTAAHSSATGTSSTRCPAAVEGGSGGTANVNRSGVSELRIDYGPGYRVYYAQRGKALVLLLCGGDKRTQDADIKRAIGIAKDWKG